MPSLTCHWNGTRPRLTLPIHRLRRQWPLQLLSLQFESLSPAVIPSHAADNEDAVLTMATSSPIQERPPLQLGYRRFSVTLPQRSLSYHEKAGLDPSDAAAEILYSHPSARIIKFSPPYSAIRSASNPLPQDLDYPVDTVETLPWASTTETTMASGLLIIEKVQGSTNFLKSGDVMHAILRNSQCWCVDGESKFVLRIRKFQYYRIELPTNSDDDRAKVEELKGLLGRILRFERTPCPFKRGFHVDLPESDITPRRKGRWKRRQSSVASTTVGETPSPVSSGRSFSTQEMQEGTRFGKAGEEEEHSTNSSEFDDEVHSESDDPRECASPSSITPASEPPADRLHESTGNESERFRNEDEIVKDEFNDHQAIADQSISNLGQSEMDSEDLPLPEALPSQEDTEQNHELNRVEPEGDAAKPKPSIVDAFLSSDTQLEAGSQSRAELSERITAVVSALDAVASELVPADVDVDDEEPQNQELDGTEGDEADASPELRSDSRPIDTISIASSSNSFHSLDAPASPTLLDSPSPPASPPSPTPRAELLDPLAIHSYNAHKRELSELTITPPSPRLEALSDRANFSPDRTSKLASDRPITPQLERSSASDGSWTDVETPSGFFPTSQIRHRLKARRSLSPLPPATTLVAPAPQQDRSNHLTLSILQKACSLVLGKPREVVVMLMHILARIAGGATVNDLINGDLFRTPGQNRQRQRNRSLPDRTNGERDDDLDEDDFGVPLRGRTRSNEIVNADDDADSLSDLD